MIYQLYASEVISSLDAPFSMYCPAFSIGNPFSSEPITLREMMAQVCVCVSVCECVCVCVCV